MVPLTGLHPLIGETTMSQKPKIGAPARAASATNLTPKEAAVKAEPAKAPQAEPAVKAEPAVEAQPVTKEQPNADVTPVVDVSPETTITPSYPVTQTIETVPDLVAAPEEAVSAIVPATADTVAAVTREVTETTSSIKPARPTLIPGMKSMMKSTEDFVAFGQANLEAFVKSGQIWSAGVQELTKQIATSAKASFDESVSTFKAISTAKSVKEAMELQSSFAKAALEKAMAESNKLTDASLKLTEQTLAPITARVTVAVETFGKAA